VLRRDGLVRTEGIGATQASESRTVTTSMVEAELDSLRPNIMPARNARGNIMNTSCGIGLRQQCVHIHGPCQLRGRTRVEICTRVLTLTQWRLGAGQLCCVLCVASDSRPDGVILVDSKYPASIHPSADSSVAANSLTPD
jgi:hypothetical protein